MATEREERNGKDHAQHASEQPVRPLPPEDRLERPQRHAGVDQAVLRDRLVAAEEIVPRRRVERRDRAANGFHCVIDSPDPVRRVAPPTTTMAITQTATVNSHAAAKTERSGETRSLVVRMPG